MEKVNEINRVQVEAQLAEKWGLTGGKLIFVWDRFNLIYRWTGGKDAFVKVTAAEARSFEEVTANMAYQQHLFLADVRVPEAFPALDGRLAVPVELFNLVRAQGLGGAGDGIVDAGRGHAVSFDAQVEAWYYK